MLTWVLAAAALAAGVTGAWSPCGFSMVETLAPAGYAGRLRTTLVACLTFTLGALAGGVLTFGGLATLGGALGSGGTAAAVVAAAIAVAAAVGEARGTRIVPQVRRQVPESWRRLLPVPLAAGLYGVLLGLGFTTFILTFAVWALAAVSVALGDPALGAVLGLAFGAGRALPVIALAPVADGDRGNAAHAAMAERPAILRGLRVADAVALAVCAAVIGAAPAQAAPSATVAADAASGPAADGALFAFQRPGGVGYLRRDGATLALPGRDPALAAGLVGWREGARIVLADPATLVPVATYDSPGGGAFAFSDQWVVWLVGTSELVAQPRNATAPPRVVARAGRGEQLGRPGLAGQALVFHRAGRAGSQIRLLDLGSGREQLLRSERRALLLNPSFDGGAVLYVRSTYTRQELRLGPPVPRATTRDRRIFGTTPTGRRDAEREKGHRLHRQGYPGGRRPRLPPRPRAGITDTLWTTALGPTTAYVTRLRLRGGTTAAAVLSVPR
ncbi:MAG: hypothetical protein QOC68_4491 [Solirubrobacteraceae bacterium]|nr:hypothetical protein [Solirubrobacteraceae bacterium]